jgi:hypothetical protein
MIGTVNVIATAFGYVLYTNLITLSTQSRTLKKVKIMAKKLMRTWYSTDTNKDEPSYIGCFSATIPDSAFRDGNQIVNVDWSRRGEVEVTYLIGEDNE